jgi:hypothetical protein
MPIKSLPACKKQLTKPITEEQSKLILIQQTTRFLKNKIESAFTKNPLADYELGLTLDTAAESETDIYRKQK